VKERKREEERQRKGKREAGRPSGGGT